MKMDRTDFASLIGFLSYHGLDSSKLVVKSIDDMIDIEVPTPEPLPIPPPASVKDVNTLLIAVKQDKKIEAIKAYRTLTGAGLKESKDAVEEHGYFPPRSQPSLGDILPKKTAKKLKFEMLDVIDSQSDGDGGPFVLNRFSYNELQTIRDFICSFDMD